MKPRNTSSWLMKPVEEAAWLRRDGDAKTAAARAFLEGGG